MGNPSIRTYLNRVLVLVHGSSKALCRRLPNLLAGIPEAEHQARRVLRPQLVPVQVPHELRHVSVVGVGVVLCHPQGGRDGGAGWGLAGSQRRDVLAGLQAGGSHVGVAGEQAF